MISLYRFLYPQVETQLRQLLQFHGSVARDLFIDHARGKFAVDDHGTKLLRELREAGEIVALERAPTASQRAFAGLSYNRRAYAGLTVDDVPEHFMWRWVEPANDNGTSSFTAPVSSRRL